MQQVVIEVKLLNIGMKPSCCESLEEWKHYLFVLAFEDMLNKGFALESKGILSVKVHICLKIVACQRFLNPSEDGKKSAFYTLLEGLEMILVFRRGQRFFIL